MRSFALSTASILLSLTVNIFALNIDFGNTQSISNAAKTIVAHILDIYDGPNGSGIPGLFPDDYYFWESGLAWDSLIRYSILTGDDTYDNRISEALLWQVGPSKDYLPPNQTKSEDNDDQATWALAAMTAAEGGFPSPPASSGVKSWLQLAQNVFDTQALRWDDKTCGGGLRWQIYSFNLGYDYKNTLSNGDFMQLAARLARYTGNQTYSDWAARASAWSLDVGLVDDTSSNDGSLAVYDGATISDNCKHVNKIQYTAALGTYMSGYVYMYNNTQTKQWSNSAASLFLHTLNYFGSTPDSPKDGIITEVACAPQHNCNTDQLAFRAILARALANAKVLASGQNFTTVTTSNPPQNINTLLRTSAEGAAAQCSGGTNGTICGSNWASSKWDGTQGLGQDLSALEIILANMPAKGVRNENGTSTTGGSATTTSGGGAATHTNDTASHALSIAGLLTAVIFALVLAV